MLKRGKGGAVSSPSLHEPGGAHCQFRTRIPVHLHGIFPPRGAAFQVRRTERGSRMALFSTHFGHLGDRARSAMVTQIRVGLALYDRP